MDEGGEGVGRVDARQQRDKRHQAKGSHGDGKADRDAVAAEGEGVEQQGGEGVTPGEAAGAGRVGWRARPLLLR